MILRIFEWRSCSSRVAAVLLFFLFLSLPQNANCGAWLPEPNNSNLIVSNYLKLSDSQYEQNAYEIYYERGIFKNTAFVFEQSITQIDERANLDEAMFALRFSAFKTDNWVGSMQLGAIGNLSKLKDISKIGYEARAMIGRGFNSGTWVNMEYATRNCQGLNSNRWEATIGQSFENDDKLILKAFGENDACGAQISRAQASYVKDFNGKFSIELGARFGIKQNEEKTSNGLIFGIWKKF